MRRLRDAAATLLLAALSCSGSPTAGAARGHVASSGAFHLLDRLEEARVLGSLRGLDGNVEAPGAGELVLRCDFDQLPAAPWFDGAWTEAAFDDAESPLHARGALAGDEGTTALALAAEDGGLHRLLAAPEGASYLVTARVKVRPGGDGGGLKLLAHRFDLPDERGIAAALRTIDGRERGSSRLVAASEAGEWRELALLVPPDPGRRCMSLSLHPSTKGMLVDSVVVRRLAAPAVLGFSPRLPFDRGLAPQRRLVPHGEGVCEALLVPSGSRIAWRVPVPERRPRLRFVPGAIDARAVELVVRVDGVELARFASPGPEARRPGLQQREVDLARFRGREVELELAVESEADAIGWFGAPELLGASTVPPPSFLLISIDTLRADHLGCYGDARRLSPRIDALAAAGTRFGTVWSPSGFTLPNHLSMMSGQHPLVHGGFSHEYSLDPTRTRTIAARMRESGRCTAAFTGGGLVHPRLGFASGFELYATDDPCGFVPLKRTREQGAQARAKPPQDEAAPVLEWLAAHADQPFFLFVHTYVVHNYFPERRHLARLADPDALVADDTPLELRDLAMRGDPAALARLRSLYAATVAEADEALVGCLLDELERLGLSASTFVCLVSDHGEELLEHGGAGHRTLHVECTRVPWILRGPGVPAGVVRDEAVDLADVAPTLAALAGLEPDPRVHGRDRLAADRGPAGEQDEEPRLLTFHDPPARLQRDALLHGPWKLLRWRAPGEEPRFGLYDLESDPREEHDVSGEDPARLRALAAALAARWRDLEELSARLPHRRADLSELTPEQEAALRALGYLDE